MLKIVAHGKTSVLVTLKTGEEVRFYARQPHLGRITRPRETQRRAVAALVEQATALEQIRKLLS